MMTGLGKEGWMQQAVADFVAKELGCAPSRLAKLDAFPGNAVYEVDADGRGFIVKASTNHDALRAESVGVRRAGARPWVCAAPAILRFGGPRHGHERDDHEPRRGTADRRRTPRADRGPAPICSACTA